MHKMNKRQDGYCSIRCMFCFHFCSVGPQLSFLQTNVDPFVCLLEQSVLRHAYLPSNQYPHQYICLAGLKAILYSIPSYIMTYLARFNGQTADFPGFTVIQAAVHCTCLSIGIGDFSCHCDQIPGKGTLKEGKS